MICVTLFGGRAIFIRAIRSEALPDPGAEALLLGGWPVLLARTEAGLAATINRCSHAAAAFLPGGRIRRGVLMCPAHGARFNLSDGACIGGLYKPLRTFPCREQDGWVEVNVPDNPPGPDEQPLGR